MHVVRDKKAYMALKKDPQWESLASNIDDIGDIPRLTGGLVEDANRSDALDL